MKTAVTSTNAESVTDVTGLQLCARSCAREYHAARPFCNNPANPNPTTREERSEWTSTRSC